jgi:transposase InsO family protein
VGAAFIVGGVGLAGIDDLAGAQAARLLASAANAQASGEYAAPGELVHLDIEQLGPLLARRKRVLDNGVQRSRRAGWQYAHVAVDDHSRVAHVELRPSQRGQDCAAFVQAVILAYAKRGTSIQRILTDNGGGYCSGAFATLLRQDGIRHISTRPYRPRTNGKAEAFIRILQREWACAYIYLTSAHRAKALPGQTRWYNNHRPHGGITATHPSAASHTLRGPTSRSYN